MKTKIGKQIFQEINKKPQEKRIILSGNMCPEDIINPVSCDCIKIKINIEIYSNKLERHQSFFRIKVARNELLIYNSAVQLVFLGKPSHLFEFCSKPAVLRTREGISHSDRSDIRRQMPSGDIPSVATTREAVERRLSEIVCGFILFPPISRTLPPLHFASVSRATKRFALSSACSICEGMEVSSDRPSGA
ncbi:hypothetical protein CDAR_288711 [Caerostris darwini]|uniref:Uncharacterized protein n=1 Tax=Caerostris darwini TaxID=1538125 RepID=A0AAV4S4Z1_9ARAC|nr:hypothetical protein CDAR_288711 [Caerostris darwini]